MQKVIKMRKKFMNSLLLVLVFTLLASSTAVFAESSLELPDGWVIADLELPDGWIVSEYPVTLAEFFAEDFASRYALIADEFGAEFASNYFMSVEALNALKSSMPQDRFGNILYPSDFGGVYIDDQGVLVTLVVGTNTSRFDAALSGFEVNIVREVDFSYGELRDTMDILRKTLLHNATDDIIANGWYVDVKKNRVVVELVNYTPENIALFRNTVLDSPTLVFVACPGLPVALSSPDQLPNILPLVPGADGTMGPINWNDVNWEQVPLLPKTQRQHHSTTICQLLKDCPISI